MSHPRVSSVRRVLGEGALIVASVYLAIVLEGWSSQRAEAADARAGLQQVRSELLADRADLQEILQEQRELSALYQRLLAWLDAPASMPTDSVHRALVRLGATNRTMFPRRGAWTSMVSSGRLAAVGDDRLVARLGSFYGNITERLEYNGRDYDYNLNEVARVTVSEVWDRSSREPIGDLRSLRNQLAYVDLAWTQFYLDLLAEYEAELLAVLEDLDRHLGLEGSGP
jgi:hypothetical protein